jgi:hypothetical protein
MAYAEARFSARASAAFVCMPEARRNRMNDMAAITASITKKIIMLILNLSFMVKPSSPYLNFSLKNSRLPKGNDQEKAEKNQNENIFLTRKQK